jgi:hypothetical protein
MKHSLNKDVFHNELQKRGWNLNGPENTWIAPLGSTRVKMEQDWLECLLAAIHCPHEEAGVE